LLDARLGHTHFSEEALCGEHCGVRSDDEELTSAKLARIEKCAEVRFTESADLDRGSEGCSRCLLVVVEEVCVVSVVGAADGPQDVDRPCPMMSGGEAE